MSLRGFVPRSAALSQKAALQMPFAVTTPSVKKSGSETPAGVSEPQIIIIFFPLKMRRANAERILNRPALGQAFSEGLLRSTLRMILRTGRMLLAFMDSSSTPMRRKVSVRAVSAPSSPQMPTQMP